MPESEARLLPDDLAGRDAVELGCGTAHVPAWLARRGARPVGIDTSPRQLGAARRLQAEHGLRFPLHLGNAEATPFADAGFDVAISEDGASVWCEPRRWVAEAARLLRPGGELVFLVNGLLLTLCTPEDPARVDDPVTERPSSASAGSPGRTARSSSSSRTGRGFACSAPTASKSSTWSSSGLPPARPRPTPSSPSTGPAAGRARKCGGRGRRGIGDWGLGRA